MRRFPLDNWETRQRGYKFLSPTTYSAHHLGLDISANIGENLYCPTKGFVANVTSGPQGGKTIWLVLENGWLVRYLHLDKIVVAPGQPLEEGQIVGKSGNSGLTTGPHLHMDISRDGELRLNDLSNFIDPEVNLQMLVHPSMDKYNDKIVRNPLGQFGLVVRGKKFIMPQDLGTLALITFLQRLPSPNAFDPAIVNISQQDWDALPVSPNLSFN